jgi:hypothetical protein
VGEVEVISAGELEGLPVTVVGKDDEVVFEDITAVEAWARPIVVRLCTVPSLNVESQQLYPENEPAGTQQKLPFPQSVMASPLSVDTTCTTIFSRIIS